MGPFNKREKAYIKALANVTSHQTVRYNSVGQTTKSLSAHPNPRAHQGDDTMSYYLWCLGDVPQTYTDGSSDTLQQDSIMQPIDCYHIPRAHGSTLPGDGARVTNEFFLEKVHARIRVIQQLDTAANDHMEYRMIVFRHKEKQHADVRFAENFSNPLGDMFLSQGLSYYGPESVRGNVEEAGNIDYSPHTTFSPIYSAQSALQDLTNKKDYVIMKDCRFYLGKEYGGKHIFETTIKWDHQDPIDTTNDDITYQDNSDKNYCWYIWLGYVNNEGTPPADPYVRIDTITTGTSG